jgi:hypothetical protein
MCDHGSKASDPSVSIHDVAQPAAGGNSPPQPARRIGSVGMDYFEGHRLLFL